MFSAHGAVLLQNDSATIGAESIHQGDALDPADALDSQVSALHSRQAHAASSKAHVTSSIDNVEILVWYRSHSECGVDALSESSVVVPDFRASNVEIRSSQQPEQTQRKHKYRWSVQFVRGPGPNREVFETITSDEIDTISTPVTCTSTDREVGQFTSFVIRSTKEKLPWWQMIEIQSTSVVKIDNAWKLFHTLLAVRTRKSGGPQAAHYREMLEAEMQRALRLQNIALSIVQVANPTEGARALVKTPREDAQPGGSQKTAESDHLSEISQLPSGFVTDEDQ